MEGVPSMQEDEISEEELRALEEELERELFMERENSVVERRVSRSSVRASSTAAPSRARRPVGGVFRVSTGVAELDNALEGGVPKGSWVAITGEPGTGKSILCMHFAWAGLQAGDPVVYVTTEAEFRDVVRQAKQFGMDFEQYRIHDISSREEPSEPPQIVVIDIFGLLKIARQMSEASMDAEAVRKRRFAALDIQTLVAAIREAYRILGVLKSEKSKAPYKHVRLIIDSLSAFWADKPAMARKYSYELKVATHRENVTAYLVSQYAMTTKSVSHDTPIVIMKDGVVKVTNIGDFVDKYFKQNEEGVKVINEPIYTLSIDLNSMRIVWKRIKAVARHRENRKMLRVEFEGGRYITITKDHSLYVLRDYEVVPVKGEDLRPGDLVPTPTYVPLNIARWRNRINVAYELWRRGLRDIYIVNVPEKLIQNEKFLEIVRRDYKIHHDTRHYWRIHRVVPLEALVKAHGEEVFNYIDRDDVFIELATRSDKGVVVSAPIRNVIEIDRDFARFLGYLVSDGYVGENRVVIYFGKDDRTYVEDVLRVVRRLSDRIPIFVSEEKNMLMVRIYSKALQVLLEEVFDLKYKRRERRIPSLILAAPEDIKVEFLKGLYAGDGHFNKANGSLIYTTCSKTLLSELCLMLLSLGVKSFSIREKRSNFAKDSCFDIVVNNVKDLSVLKSVVAHLGYELPKRKYGVNRIEKVPRDIVVGIVKKITPSKRVTSSSYTQFGKSKYVTKERLRSRLFEAPVLGTVARNILSQEIAVDGDRDLLEIRRGLEFLHRFAYGEVGFLEVRRIEEVEVDNRYVYDLSVEDTENFVAGLGWVLAHNSTFGFGLEHIADGVFHLWMDDVERVKEVRRYFIIKKMRMTNHARHAFRVEIEPGHGFRLLPI